ncbi:MAG TPA: hypothetical protein VH592_09520 [Gemmataceae bacterium]
MRRIGRSILRRIYGGILLLILLVFMLSMAVTDAIEGRPPAPKDHPVLMTIAFAFWIWVFVGQWVSCLLVPLFVSTLSCPGCGEEIDAVGIWDCGCGFHDHRERHILAGGCPACGDVTGHINCPRCDTTIMLW